MAFEPGAAAADPGHRRRLKADESSATRRPALSGAPSVFPRDARTSLRLSALNRRLVRPSGPVGSTRA
ncbi:hypothetical protein BVI1335_2020012 [Burkholderia vietnamiensis]|nr:hypothetical protein BVI1335_2020012 [Burkholderia vietnamiensis]